MLIECINIFIYIDICVYMYVYNNINNNNANNPIFLKWAKNLENLQQKIYKWPINT